MRKGFPQMRREAGAATLGVRAARTERAWHFLELREASAVGFAAMGDTMDHDLSGGVIDGIEHTVSPNTQAVGMRVAGELFCVEGPWILRQSFNGIADSDRDLSREAVRLAVRGRGIEDVIQGQHASMTRGLWPWGSVSWGGAT